MIVIDSLHQTRQYNNFAVFFLIIFLDARNTYFARNIIDKVHLFRDIGTYCCWIVRKSFEIINGSQTARISRSGEMIDKTTAMSTFQHLQVICKTFHIHVSVQFVCFMHSFYAFQRCHSFLRKSLFLELFLHPSL